jgi:hypothetical protein
MRDLILEHVDGMVLPMDKHNVEPIPLQLVVKLAIVDTHNRHRHRAMPRDVSAKAPYLLDTRLSCTRMHGRQIDAVKT